MKEAEYTGHTPCRQCGQTHWMHGPCHEISLDQKRIKIAEVCEPWDTSNHEGSKYKSWADYVERVCGAIDELPDYFHCLNAMHEAEKVLYRGIDQQRYWQAGYGRYKTILGELVVEPLSATARQRAEAFGLTLGLWT